MARTEACAVNVAREVGIRRVSDWVIRVPLALNAALAGGSVVGLEATTHKQPVLVVHIERGYTKGHVPIVRLAADVVVEDTTMGSDLADRKSECGESADSEHVVQVLDREGG